MRVVIPMAGHSERFKKAGYAIPKPFIKIDGRPMIHWVCDMFSSEDDFVFVVQKEHNHNAEYQNILKTAAPRHVVVDIDSHRLGPIYTSLAADNVVDAEEPVLIVYSDFYQHWNYQQFLRCIETYDGGMSVLKGFHPVSFGKTIFGHLRCNAKGEMLEIKEKGSFTDKRHEEPASSGVYYLKSWGLFRQLAKDLLDSGDDTQGEYYISQIFNSLVKNGMKVMTFEIDRFVGWGTPEDLEMYCFWSDYFKNDAPKILNG